MSLLILLLVCVASWPAPTHYRPHNTAPSRCMGCLRTTEE